VPGLRTLMTTVVLAAAGVATALAVTGRAPAATRGGTLHGSVGPGFTISLKDDGGNPVTHLNPGQYTIVVDDQSEFHNFDLSGPGVEQRTDVDATGSVTWNVTLADGVYTFICDAHPTLMKGAFAVGSATVPATTTSTTSTAPPKTLVGNVGPGYTIRLAGSSGRTVRRLVHGRYRIVVHDRSSSHDFHLSGPGVDKRTSVAGVGTKSWVVTLRKGTYRFRCDVHGTIMRGSFKVT
jgi:plastocyanin